MIGPKTVALWVSSIVLLLLVVSSATGSLVLRQGGSLGPQSPHGSDNGGLPRLLAVTATLREGYSAKCNLEKNPQFAAYDPVNHYVYVSSLANYITVLNSTVTNGACGVKTNIKLPAGAAPAGIAYAPADGQLYVADSHLNQVYVINGTKVVNTITNATCQASVFTCAFTEPFAVAYDPDKGEIMVTNSGADNVTVVDANAFQGGDYSITTGGSVPDGIAYSPSGDVMEVSNWGSNSVSWFTAQYSQAPVVSSIPVGTEPIGIVADPFLSIYGYSYVTNYGSNNVTTIAPNGALGYAPSISVGQGPISIVFDQANLHVYVSNHFSRDVSVIGGAPGSVIKTITLPKTAYPEGLVYDDENGEVYAIDGGTDTMYLIS